MKRGFRKPLKVGELRKKKWQQEYEKKSLEHLEQVSLGRDLDQNIDSIRQIFGESDDLVVRNFNLGGNQDCQAAVIYLDGLADKYVLDEYILASLMFEVQGNIPEAASHEYLFTWIKDNSLNINEVGETEKMGRLVNSILTGDSALLIDQVDKALLLNTKGWERRGVEEPETESVVRGSRDGFTETMRINTALVRRRLKDPKLRLKGSRVGERTNTDVALMYIEGLTEEKLLKEIESRIKEIDIDGVLESGYIEQLIEDHPWSPFPQIQNTERPDKVAANLLEGKVAIFVDGSPFVLIAPAIFTQFYHSPEDYYERFLISTLIRLLRIVSLFMAILLPSLYIAFSSFHPEMIPSKFVIAMAAGRSTVPFPSIIEAILMEVSIEILREASIRLPGLIGPTIGIVGALVIGEAAVTAGVVSPIMVIVVALTTIGSFATPSYSAAIAFRMLRFPMMIAAGMFGLYGIMLFGIIILIHLCSLKSFGVPYMSPFSPSRIGDWKDTAVRVPMYRMKKRPSVFQPDDSKRVGSHLMKKGNNNSNE